ncbi:MAG: phosphoribosylformylglycinamidine synthase subunit PurL, partial [Bacteroidia bacterium]|nr:phosphoribosylformylglycinamidine synthase subunit PurL [Bacteroidia bacterium]
NFRKDAYLFGETQGRVVLSIAPGNKEKLEQQLAKTTVPFELIGTVKGKNLIIDGENFGTVANAADKYDTAIEKLL